MTGVINNRKAEIRTDDKEDYYVQLNIILKTVDYFVLIILPVIFVAKEPEDSRLKEHIKELMRFI